MKVLSRYDNHRRRLGSVVWIVLIIAGFLAWDYTSLSYWFYQEERVINVVETKTEVSRSQKCVGFGKGICTQYQTVTETDHLVLSPSETFYIASDLYSELEAGRTYYVTLRGWPRSISPRWISDRPGALLSN